MTIKKEEGRLSIKTEHGESELLYKIEGKVMSIYHTFTPDDDRGKGIAEQLTAEAFSIAKSRGLKVRPDCSYAAHFLEKHSEWRAYAVQ